LKGYKKKMNKSKITNADYDLLVKDSTIILREEIDKNSVEHMMNILAIAESRGSPDLLLKINSMGGEAYKAMIISSLIMDYSGQVRGEIVFGCCADSVVLCILQHCDERIARDGEKIFFHKSKFTDQDSLEKLTADIHNDMASGDQKNIAKMKKIEHDLDVLDGLIITSFSDRSGLSQEDCRGMLASNKYWPVQELMGIGFFDEVVPHI
jgi:ATP-dependent protease ClpP protease subunit